MADAVAAAAADRGKTAASADARVPIEADEPPSSPSSSSSPSSPSAPSRPQLNLNSAAVRSPLNLNSTAARSPQLNLNSAAVRSPLNLNSAAVRSPLNLNSTAARSPLDLNSTAARSPEIREVLITLALPAPNAPPPQLAPTSPSSAAARRIPPPCWTHEETLALIDAYGAKWAALRRGNLRANHWEEVSGNLEAMSRDLPGAKPKTAMQCRHKMEKLRKRYRTERQRSLKARPRAPPVSSWVYFRRMDALEFGAGPNPTTGLALARRTPSKRGPSDDDDQEEEVPASESDEEDDDEGGAGGSCRRTTPVPHDPAAHRANGGGFGNGPSPLRVQIPRATRTNRSNVGVLTNEAAAAAARPGLFSSMPSVSSNGRTRFLGRFPGTRPRLQCMHNESGSRRWEGESNRTGKRARDEEEDDSESDQEEEDQEEEPVPGGSNTDANVMEKVVAAVRMLGDGFMQMEQMKMDLTREFERARMDMELKYTEMMLQSQRRIMDCVIKSLASNSNKKRRLPP